MNKRRIQGFTIIEVVLVLAIVGLIFLMVFVALPSLNRGQRDTGRKDDVGIVVSALNTYLSNNKGFTGINSSKLQSYIDQLSQYEATDVNVTTSNPTAEYTATPGTIEVRIGAKCSGTGTNPDKQTFSTATGRQASVVVGLENNGSQTIAYCQSL